MERILRNTTIYFEDDNKYFHLTEEDIRNSSEEVQLEAIKQSPKAIEYIRNPSERIKVLYQQLYGKK